VAEESDHRERDLCARERDRWAGDYRVEVAGVVGAQKSRFPSGMTNKKGKGEKQIPFGNDKQKGQGREADSLRE
jgi:hypothetical protein